MAGEIILYPLGIKQFEKYISNGEGSIRTEADKAWVVKYHFSKINEHNWIYYTFWVVLDERGNMIGETAFKGIPTMYGEIELGYWVKEEYRNQGYATKIVKKMVEWATRQPEIYVVVAGVLPENEISQKVVKKCNFEYCGEFNSHLIFCKKLKPLNN